MIISQVPGIVTCSFNRQFGFSMHEWTTFYCDEKDSARMRFAMEKFLDFVKKYKVTKHIVNVKFCKDAFSESDLKWITDYLVPKEMEYGIKYLANIRSEDLYTEVSTAMWQGNIADGLVLKNCTDFTDALRWLANKIN